MPAHWRFGVDPTCLARIHPGNGMVSTPRTLSYRSGLELRKAGDGNRSPKSGWVQVTQDDFQTLVQETDASSGLPMIQFLPDPTSPDRLQARQATEKARARARVGLEQDQLKDVVREVLAEAGLIPAAAPKPEPAPALDPEEAEPVSAPLSALSLDDDDDEEALVPRRKRSSKKKSGRLKLSSEG